MNKPTVILNSDCDHMSYERMCMVFYYLNKYEIPFTTAMFYTLEDYEEFPHQRKTLAKHCREYETVSFTDKDRNKTIKMLKYQLSLKNEVAYHGYSQISNTKEQFVKGVCEINSLLNYKVQTYIEHGGKINHHPIGMCKKEGLLFHGTNTTTPYYVVDAIRDNFSYSWTKHNLVGNDDEQVRNLSHEEIFYKEHDLTCFRRYRAKDLFAIKDSMKEGDVCIAYTHFGYDGHPSNYKLESWYNEKNIIKNCEQLSSLRDDGFNLTTIEEYYKEKK